MKIELTEMAAGEAPRADGRGEAHIRVLTDVPIGPQEWGNISKAVAGARPDFFEKYEQSLEKFYEELTELEDGESAYDDEGHGWEQWFVVRARATE